MNTPYSWGTAWVRGAAAETAEALTFIGFVCTVPAPHPLAQTDMIPK